MSLSASSSRERKREREQSPDLIDGEVEDDDEQDDPETFARSYQLDALEMAKKQNTIVYLETGSGKTLVAVMLLRSYAHLLRKPGHFIGVFLVPTVVLVTQQAQVIEMHTDFKVARFWGEMGVDSWDGPTWTDKLQQSEVFVMTPKILLNCLYKTFIKLDQIKLLIFDECHHAKGRSDYASIMTHFYHRQLKSNPSVELPRVFGMTASPIDSKGSNYSKQILELETLMNSKVFTVSSESIIAKYIPFATPKIKLYEDSSIPSNLYNTLHSYLEKLKLEHLSNLDKEMLDDSMLQNAKLKIKRRHDTILYCLNELGPWLANKAAEEFSRKEKDLFFWGEIKDTFGKKAGRMFSAAVYENFLRYIPKDLCLGDNEIKAELLTAKVQCLIECLTEYREVKGLRCIVFVQRIVTAVILKSLLKNITKFSQWGIEFMTGQSSRNVETQSQKEQNKIINSFRNGEVNIIVATQILEEGLDVPNCNLVIRFDPSCTISSFIQSKGRARKVNSHYLILLKRGDESMQSKIRKFLASGEEMREESIKLALIPCENLETEISNEEFYLVEKTGAIVTLNSSISLIYSYCSKLPADRYFKSMPRFEINVETGMSTLYLPKTCPVQVVRASGRKEKYHLKRIVCLDACKILHEIGALNDYLLPQSGSLSDDDDTDDYVTGEVEYNEEQPNYIPGILLDSWNKFSVLGLYHCYRISFNKQKLSKHNNLEDIILVMSSNLGPDFASLSFNLNTETGPLDVSIEYIKEKNHLSRRQVMKGRKFQVNVFSLLIDQDFNTLKNKMDRLSMCENQKIFSSREDIVYLLLPCKNGRIDWSTIMSSTSTFDKITNNAIHNSSSNEGFVETKDGFISDEMIRNSVVYTPHSDDFYCVTEILDNLNSHSSFQLRTGEFISYKRYYKSRHGIDLINESAPLLSGQHVVKAQNFLTKRISKKEKARNRPSGHVELPPELCRIIMCPLSISILNSFTNLPTIMYRIQCMLLASSLKVQLSINMVPTIKILEAMTAKKCHEEYSLESLETLGDSFLKYAASKYLFAKYKNHHEGLLSPKKERIISNYSLSRLGCFLNLPGYVRIEEFNPKQWAIPCLNEDENTYNISSINEIYIKGKRSIKSKTIADFIEALIGAVLSTAGEASAFLFLEELGIGIKFPIEMGIERPVLEKPEIFVNVKELERLLSYKFKDPSLLVEALTHGSYQIPDIPQSYQRLEFLGDAILDHCITIYLYEKYYQILTPGLLTDLRSASVNNDCYAHAAVKAGLNKHVLHASSELHRHITTYLHNFTNNSFSGSSFGWDAGLALPKVLGDVIESLAGAIYVDCDCDKEVVWRSIKPLLEPIVTPETMEYHPVRELEELCSSKCYEKSYELLTCLDGQSCIRVQVEADGVVYSETKSGPNKKTAQKIAAKAVLLRLKDRLAL